MRREFAALFGAFVLAGGQAVAGSEVRPARPAEYSLGDAHVAIVERDYARAVRHLEEVLETDPQSWDARRLLGDCLMSLDRAEEAVVHYREWARLRPADDDADRAVERALARHAAQQRERDAREQERRTALRPRFEARPLGDLSRPRLTPGGRVPVYTLQGEPGGGYTAPPISADAPMSLLDGMRERAEAVMRPAMSAVAGDARGLQAARRQYDDACAGRTTTTTRDGERNGYAVTHSGGYDPHTGAPESRRWSETWWVERWRSIDRTRNEETPQCLALASDVATYSTTVGAALAAMDGELSQPPAVYPGIREQVFHRLVGELW